VFAGTDSTSSRAKNREPTRINAARKIIEEHVDDIRTAWAKHFGG
jgi:hypothetical protein